MKLGLVGATGHVGSPLLAEALGRGHAVTAIARDVAHLADGPRLTPVAVDLADTERLVPHLVGVDAVIVAVKHEHIDLALILRALARAGGPRLLVIGGAGSLEVAPGRCLVDTPDFPAQYRGEALAARDALTRLRREAALDWTFLSPAAQLTPGQRTAKFRLGGDQLLSDAAGKSAISVEDLAVAALDEIETPRHRRTRFTAAY